MNKQDMIIVTNELRDNVTYPGVGIESLSGCGLSDFPHNKPVRKEAIVMHLRWQCIYLNGAIDEEQLSQELTILKKKNIIMI